jgi:hypothetical protein
MDAETSFPYRSSESSRSLASSWRITAEITAITEMAAAVTLLFRQEER